ncbi:MAG: ribonuclease III [Candidatus Paceibacteria bacterium]
MNDISSLKEFEKEIGITFTNGALLQTALTHRSYVNEAADAGEHNERLEFLGDAVLELVVTSHLFRRYPDTPEGVLTAYRAALVNTNMLGVVAESLKVGEYLRLSRGEANDAGRTRASILANTFEAVVGAIYLDQGYEAARAFIAAHVIPKMDEVVASGAWKDAKSAFQEFAQEKYGQTPHYEVVHAEGPDHDKRFVVSVLVGDVSKAEGEGRSKQEAEQEAAKKALAEEK